MGVKYPRTSHLPWSPGASGDDVRAGDVLGLVGQEVVVTEKLDGENTTLHRDGMHARSLDSGAHPSRTWVKRFAALVGPSLPEGVRVCGENLFARHSLAYGDLDSFFYGFSVWEHEQCWDWDRTVDFLHARGIPTPRVIWRGIFDARFLRRLQVPRETQEGYVVRTVAGFSRADFGARVGKWVRPGHVTTDAHWMHQPVVPNTLGPQAVLWSIRSGAEPVAAELDAWAGDERPLLERRLPIRGERRLVAVLAGRWWGADRARLRVTLADRLPAETARHVADLVGLGGRLTVPMPDERRVGGLVSLGRAVDLELLHTLEPAHEQVSWSALVAEEAGLLQDPLHERWTAALRGMLPALTPSHTAWIVSKALWARSRGALRSPEEALAVVHPLLAQAPPTLTVLVGCSGSGKSTVAQGLSGVVVSLDALREEQVLDPLAPALATMEGHLAGGRDVIWDATSLTATQRLLPAGRAREQGAMVRMLAVLAHPHETEVRNRARDRVVPAEILQRQWRRLDWPWAWEADVVEAVRASR